MNEEDIFRISNETNIENWYESLKAYTMTTFFIPMSIELAQAFVHYYQKSKGDGQVTSDEEKLLKNIEIEIENIIQSFKEETNGKWVGYDKIPLNIVPKVNKLMKEMKESLHNIDCPALLFQGRLDSQIKANSIDFIFDNIASEMKKKIWLENSDHPILNIPDHAQIISELTKFIDKIVE